MHFGHARFWPTASWLFVPFIRIIHLEAALLQRKANKWIAPTWIAVKMEMVFIHSSNKFRIHILAIFLRTEIVNHIGIRNYIYFYSNCRRFSNDSRQTKNRITLECKVVEWLNVCAFVQVTLLLFSFLKFN